MHFLYVGNVILACSKPLTVNFHFKYYYAPRGCCTFHVITVRVEHYHSKTHPYSVYRDSVVDVTPIRPRVSTAYFTQKTFFLCHFSSNHIT